MATLYQIQRVISFRQARANTFATGSPQTRSLDHSALPKLLRAKRGI